MILTNANLKMKGGIIMSVTTIAEGQIWRQSAIINNKAELDDHNEIEIIMIAVNGEILQQQRISRRDFKNHFLKDELHQGFFIRFVKIIEVTDKHIKCVRLNNKGQQITDAQTVLKELFFKNHSCQPNDQQISQI